ncbi:MAG: hypothetical protein AB7N24_21725 [Dehalococcoidia bacterium]
MDYFALADAIYSDRRIDDKVAFFREQWYQFRAMDRLEKKLSLARNRLGVARPRAEVQRIDAPNRTF